MSDNSTLTQLAQQVIASYAPSLVYNYFVLSSAVIILYDFILTLPLEISHIWNGSFNIMKVLFVLNRYGGLFGIYGNVLINFVQPTTDIICRSFYYFLQTSNVLSAIGTSGIFTLRTFAIYEKSWPIFVVLATSGIVNVAMQIWATVAEVTLAYPPELQVGPNTCAFNPTSSFSFATQLIMNISGVIFDAVVLILTVYRTAKLAVQSRRYHMKGSLSYILLRDGLFYYAAICMPTFVSVVLYAVDVKYGNFNANISYGASDLGFILGSITNVLVNRLVLNLSHSVNTQEDTEFYSRIGHEPPEFIMNSVIGSIGAPLRTLVDDLYDLDESQGGKDVEYNMANSWMDANAKIQDPKTPGTEPASPDCLP